MVKDYELHDYEKAMNLKEFNDKVVKEMKKQEKPKTKPQDIFVGYTKPKNTKKTRKTGPRFKRSGDLPPNPNY